MNVSFEFMHYQTQYKENPVDLHKLVIHNVQAKVYFKIY